MKNLFTTIIILLIASVALTSCKNNMSLTKRHYRKGYFVEHSSKQKSIKTADVIKVKPQNMIVNKTIEPVNQEIVYANVTKTEETNQNSIVKSQTNLNEGKKNNLSLPYISTAKHYSPVNVKANNQKTNLKSLSQLKKSFLSASDDDARSFFWTIILLIVIIWLIAVLVGGIAFYGGLVNLLLLIALIFFILWLLRIV